MMNNKVHSVIYLVEDGFGNRDFATCEDGNDNVMICGMQNSGEEPLYFDSDGYHIQEWCIVNNLKYKCVEMVYDFDALWDGHP